MKKNVILVIDDEKEIRALLTRFLGRKGYSVLSAGTLGDGRRILDQNNPNMIFLDVNLPDGNGLEELQHLMPAHPSSKVIMMSAFDHQEARQEALESGAIDFLSKPFNMARLLEVIQIHTNTTTNS